MHIPRKFATATPHGWVSGPRVGPVETHGCTGTRFTPLVMSVVVTMSLDPHWGNMSRTTFVPMNVPCSVCALDVDAAVWEPNFAEIQRLTQHTTGRRIRPG